MIIFVKVFKHPVSDSIYSLQGALAKTSGRSYKAAPRQLLQADAGPSSPTPSHAHVHHVHHAGKHHEGAA
jgi:DNA topoisomerase 2-associated protein PAT1